MSDDDAFAYCARQVKRHDRDRYLCALFAPPRPRRALHALYAFNLEVARVREAVSEPLLGEVRLQWWREALGEIYAGRPRRHQVVGALAAAVARHGLERAHFERLLEARAVDLDDAPPATLDELEDYAEGTSATLVWLGLEALGARGEAARAAGRHVGVAWALVGLVRALPFHAGQGRLYLPRELMEAAGVRPAEVLAARPPAGLGRVTGALLDAAVKHLAEARARRREVPREALPALLPAALADAYIARLRRAGNDPFAADLGLSAPRRQLRLARHAFLGRF